MRAVSTVVDVTFCLLLISASVVTLVHAPTSTAPDRSDAESTAKVLSTSTARVDYTLPTDGDSPRRRTAHHTLAGLLADAAVVNATAEFPGLAPTRGDFEQRATRTVSDRLRSEGNARIVARWEPHPDSSIRGRAVVGPTPPPNVDVHAVVVSVPSGVPPVRERAVRAAQSDGYAAVARVVASAIERGLGSEDAGPTSGPPSALVSTIERDLRATFDTPDAAARAVAIERVTIVVRTWSG